MATFESKSSSDERVGLGDAVELGIGGRVPVGVSLEVEAGKEFHGCDIVEQAAVGVNGDNLAVLQIPR